MTRYTNRQIMMAVSYFDRHAGIGVPEIDLKEFRGYRLQHRDIHAIWRQHGRVAA
jgi:hypothetical protein